VLRADISASVFSFSFPACTLLGIAHRHPSRPGGTVVFVLARVCAGYALTIPSTRRAHGYVSAVIVLSPDAIMLTRRRLCIANWLTSLP
jgi:hypothetical protein